MIDMNLYERIRQMDDEVLAMAEDFSQAFDAAGVCWGKGTVYGLRVTGYGKGEGARGLPGFRAS